MEGLYVLLGFIVFLGPGILAIVAMTKASGSATRARQLSVSVAEIRAELRALKDQLGLSAAPAGDESARTAALSAEEDSVSEQSEQPEDAAGPGDWESAPPVTPEAESEAAAPPSQPPPPQPLPTGGGFKDFEEALASRWLVWLGAVAIGLGGIFLVKYSIERGLLGPGMRVTLGFVSGLALIFGGEFLRRRPLQRAIASIR